MNVLWICNIVFPEAEAILSGSGTLASSGGWMIGLSEELVKHEDINLTVVSVTSLVAELTKLQGEKIRYFLLPSRGYNKCWKHIKKEVKPDVVHLHGTENPFGKSYVDCCGPERVCVSIQGLLSAYYYYYYYGLTIRQIMKNMTMYSVFRGGIIRGYHSMKNNSKNEIFLLKKVNHILGRTSWDKARTWAINPNAKYHYCGEILRNQFYDAPLWTYENCQKHTIFLSQASYPIKGLHQVIKALPLILRHYPDTKLRIAGTNILDTDSSISKLKYTDYGRIIKRQLKSLKIPSGTVTFTGPLNADEMLNEYLRSNVFVSPSTIENSPNSLAEAQILGVPCVASDVGGVIEMMKGAEEYVYRFEEYTLLANYICDIFAKEGEHSRVSRDVAKKRHDRESITNQLIAIYKSIQEGNQY